MRAIPSEIGTPVVLTRADLRPFVAGLLLPTLPDVAVLSESELPENPSAQLQWIADIELPAEAGS